MQQSILNEVFEEQPGMQSYSNYMPPHNCGCNKCKGRQAALLNSEYEFEAPQAPAQGIVSKAVSTIKEMIDKGIISIGLISDFSKGKIYDERQIVELIFTKLRSKASGDPKKVREEIKAKIARRFFANLHTTLPDKNPACDPKFVIDLKAKAINKTNTKGGITFSNKSVKQSPRKSGIDAIVLHHMAVSKGYPGKKDGNDVNNYLLTGAHYIVLHDGKVAQLYDDRDYLNASDSFNGRSIAIEFAGNFPYQDFKWWNPRPTKDNPYPTHYFNYLTPAQALAGRCLVEHIKKNNPGIKYILAHRQSCGPDRPYDPGQDVWLAVGEWAIRNLGLSDKDNTGKPILGACMANCNGKHQRCPGLPIPADWRKAR